MKNSFPSLARRMSLSIVFLAVLAGLTLWVGCGSGSNSSMMAGSTTVAAASTPTSVLIADAPADNILSLEITLTSLTLTKSDNTTFSVFNTPREIEVTHLAGTSEPLVLSNVPQGTYNSATIGVGKVEVTFLNAGVPVEQQINLNTNVTVNFSPALTIGSTPLAVKIDLNAANSVTINGTSVTVNPQFLVTTKPVAQGQQDEDNGGLENVVGRVTAVDMTKNTFTIQLGQSGNTFTFATDANTKIEINDSPATSVSALVVGMLVKVEATTQMDGTLLAKSVEGLGPGGNGSEAEGLVVRIDSTAPALPFTFDVVVQDGNGLGMAANLLGQVATVNVDSNTKFTFDPRQLTIPNTAVFDAAHLSKGQRVEADSDADMTPLANMAGQITPKRVKLVPQVLSGTVANLAADQSSFTLQLDPQSAFAQLTGATQVMVIRQGPTVVKSGVTLANTSTLRVRGLVFFDGTSFTMFAVRLVPPEM